MKKNIFLFTFFLFQLQYGFAQTKINRQALVERHTIKNNTFDSLSSLSVGNGGFAFTVDVTGLQSFANAYAKGVPLGTQSDWGWHSFKDTANYTFDETLKNYFLNGRNVSYAVQQKEPLRKKNAVEWFRQNPHRLQLGNIGFDIIKKDGSLATINDIQNISQTLNMWTGEIHSHFTVENIPVDVTTYGHQQKDAIAVKVHSILLKEKRLLVHLKFPYPTGAWADVGNNFTENNNNKHVSTISSSSKGLASVKHILDATTYDVALRWNGKAAISEKSKHYFVVTPEALNSFELTCVFSEYQKAIFVPSFVEVAANSKKEWQKFWQSGAAVDFEGSTDTRANELERRIILSQYLTKIQCASNNPPQETGLTYNSWYGRPHMEMYWWHGIHFSLWGRHSLVEKSIAWYKRAAPLAKQIATRQGYDGIRWQKMTDNIGNEGPSSVGAFLIWQQPHLIYFSELSYREHKDKTTLEKYKDLVFATADFMASYAYYDAAKQKYILGPGVIPAQERFKAEETFNPTYELVYWHWALNVAQQWRERLHLPRNKKWNDVLNKLSPLPIQNEKYLFTESGTDSYTNPEYVTDHPSVFGALGMLPNTTMMDTSIMHNTFNWIWNNWSWKDTWGWDFPMTAMTATRLGLPEKAIDALLMPIETNTYLNNGHNYQDKRLTIYLPGNGGLLAAVAMMCAGYDGCKTINPGIPQNGKWKVKWEGLKRMP
jgi:protein-glucosylgalactosylhydroxylysine glucosidase